MFRLRNDCTISAVQPDVISRVSGDDKNITICLETEGYGVASASGKGLFLGDTFVNYFVKTILFFNLVYRFKYTDKYLRFRAGGV